MHWGRQPATAAAGTRVGELEIDPAARRVTLAGAPIELSRKEFDLLWLLASRAGEVVTITRDGEPVAELRPLPRQPLSAAALVEQFRHLPPLDADRLRADVDAFLDQSL